MQSTKEKESRPKTETQSRKHSKKTTLKNEQHM